MQTIVNSLAVFSFLGVIIALFAISALLKLVRGLQQTVTGMTVAAPAVTAIRSIERFAAGGEQTTFVLVVEEHCMNCAARARRLAEIATAGVTSRLVLLSAQQKCAEWVSGTDVTAVIDSELLGRIAVGATPTLVKYSADGAEVWRRAVGSDDDLDAFIGIGTHVPA
ncbi:hypothetical protein [Streptosporangium sp. NPDC000396]|uniref:hypothetical protein n=1 Tax=Streptosporangium sp. NPDC000396 TaxID=3366185 RepID=UPI00367F1246